MSDGQILVMIHVQLILKQPMTPIIEHILNLIKLLNQSDLFCFRQLLQAHIFTLDSIRLLQPFGVGHQGISNDTCPFKLLIEGGMIVLKTMLGEAFLYEGLLAGTT